MSRTKAFARGVIGLAAVIAGGVLIVLTGTLVQPVVPPVETIVANAPAAAEVPEPVPNLSPEPSRVIAREKIAPPQIAFDGLLREVPREPLSPLSQALPPQTVMPDAWEGTTLFRPVALSSAEFDAMGYRIAISGTETVDLAEVCDFEGRSWPCGIRARTAVRMWLRGRAMSCKVPPEAERFVLVVGCRFGKQDVGAWLVSNGWARAVAGGPYILAEAKARRLKIGIFAPPPQTEPAPAPAEPVSVVVEPLPSEAGPGQVDAD